MRIFGYNYFLMFHRCIETLLTYQAFPPFTKIDSIVCAGKRRRNFQIYSRGALKVDTIATCLCRFVVLCFGGGTTVIRVEIYNLCCVDPRHNDDDFDTTMLLKTENKEIFIRARILWISFVF